MSTKKKQRIQRINQMLLEMASGNFFYRLERTAKNDNFEAISISLNMLAEEIQETMLHQGYVNSNTTLLEIIQMSFIIDGDGRIEMVNQQACNILSVRHTDLLGTLFTAFLVEKSQTIWQNTWHALEQNEFQDTSLELTFKSKGSLVVPKTCYITTFKGINTNSKKTLITIIHHTTRQDHLENELKRRVMQYSHNQKQPSNTIKTNPQKTKLRLSFEDIRKIREGHNSIINNLEKDFPSLKDFALQLGTNEFKLKYGFKQLYGTTVHHFLMAERLRKSKMMIQFTDQSLKSIAYMTGFKSTAHFSRTFKKRYEYTPRDLRKNSLIGDK
ncbi:helix-turn-helix domain-containing protein [Mariniflexile litorale]|uniref:Helix-turn-helix domain-containing protein n=1 Tax=Mariniflexile litorale TaxID=3045158 RepID=A0AAU7ECR6_9FLAO|nr:helix-turn-helix domain-containing protein [Mariniflexile sp. KMM 9835]MDQ8213479.1 helix-turn-helix domain-containing protein [Mariniflexile sp. KMM 9835]